MCAGGLSGVSAAEDAPGVLAMAQGTVRQVAHIYYNLATGERVMTLVNDSQTAGADTGDSVLLWSTGGGSQCIDAGYTTSYYFGLDDNSLTSMGGAPTSLATGATMLDYGDIAKGTVVDCVTIGWVVAHPDETTSGGGGGDGVEGLGGQWTYWDAENGRQINDSTRLPLISFVFTDLPGNIFGEGSLSGYTADIDLTGTFSSSLTFEIGDSDGDLQGAAFGHNNVDTDGDGAGEGPISTLDRDFDGLPDSDLDGDGLFDWGWSVRFFQPGTADFDSDGVPDGDPSDGMHPIGVNFGFPVGGTAIDHGDGTWSVEIDPDVPGAGTGAEDRFVLFDPDGNYAGGFSFGGFACEGDPLPDGPGYVPFATFAQSLYGPSDGGDGPCHPDINGDGELNFFDVSLFLQQFQSGGDYNGDGSTNFFDVSLFIQEYNAGCP